MWTGWLASVRRLGEQLLVAAAVGAAARFPAVVGLAADLAGNDAATGYRRQEDGRVHFDRVCI